MTPKDKFDALLRLADHKARLREERRQTEWRVSFGLWALLAGTAYYLRDVLAAQPLRELIAIIACIVLVHTVFWVFPMYLRNERDGRLAHYLASRAERVVMGNEGPEIEARPKIKKDIFEIARFLSNPITMAQAGITALLGAAVLLISRFPHSN